MSWRVGCTSLGGFTRVTSLTWAFTSLPSTQLENIWPDLDQETAAFLLQLEDEVAEVRVPEAGSPTSATALLAKAVKLDAIGCQKTFSFDFIAN